MAKNKRPKIAIVGAGFAGVVLARELAESGRFDLEIFESRNHVGGNCHTEKDQNTGIMIHRYGPHIFHCDRIDVWRYVNRFGEFVPFTNRVKAITERGVFSLPINLLTINQFFNKALSPNEAKDFIATIGDQSIENPENFEEQALKFLGPELYKNFFYGYTKKQWGIEPLHLSASILKRLPIRFDYNDNYYHSTYQGLPINGYTPLIEKILDHNAIKLLLSEPFHRSYTREFSHVFYSGPIDSYFNYEVGRLGYRTLSFERFDYHGDFQGNPVINYCLESVPFTRIVEYKHFAPWERYDESVCFREYSQATQPGDTPYYPLRLSHDLKLLKTYSELAQAEKGVSFIGRLGTYRYLDMHMVIGESLDLGRLCSQTPIEQWKHPT